MATTTAMATCHRAGVLILTGRRGHQCWRRPGTNRNRPRRRTAGPASPGGDAQQSRPPRSRAAGRSRAPTRSPSSLTSVLCPVSARHTITPGKVHPRTQAARYASTCLGGAPACSSAVAAVASTASHANATAAAEARLRRREPRRVFSLSTAGPSSVATRDTGPLWVGGRGAASDGSGVSAPVTVRSPYGGSVTAAGRGLGGSLVEEASRCSAAGSGGGALLVGAGTGVGVVVQQVPSPPTSESSMLVLPSRSARASPVTV